MPVCICTLQRAVLQSSCQFVLQGNLVTNAAWQIFYLNEGFTMYLQRRILRVVHGTPFTALETVTGRSLLRGMMDDYGLDSPLTRLTVPLATGIDPDEYVERA
jgi:leukotriene-A4 hydrolase